MARRRAGHKRPAARPDPFAVLGLSREATVAEVESARRELARSQHPDVGGSAPAMIWRFDHPSFTVEALPAATFEALLVVAAWLGETIDDDPPYRLDVELAEPLPAWCRLDLVPDAGATTVSVTVGVDRNVGEPDVDLVRDAWVNGLNSLDWAEIDGSPRQP
jgi:hypothetical protein